MRLRQNQSGIAHLVPILVVVIVGLIGLVGWMVYDRRQTNSTADSAQTKQITNFDECVAAGNPVMESYPEQCAANGKTYTNPNQKVEEPSDENASSEAYFAVIELGVKFKKTQELDGVYYHIGNNGKTAYFSLDSLKNTDCSAEKTSQIALTRATEEELNIDPSGQAIKDFAQKINNYYYYTVGAQAMCSDDRSIQSKATKMRADINTAIKESLVSID